MSRFISRMQDRDNSIIAQHQHQEGKCMCKSIFNIALACSVFGFHVDTAVAGIEEPCAVVVTPQTPEGKIQTHIDDLDGDGTLPICFAPGDYNLEFTITLRNHTKLEGRGTLPSDVRINRIGTNSDPIFITQLQSSGAEIHNMSINGNDVASYGILLAQSFYNEINHVHIDRVHDIPIGVVETYHVYLFNLNLGSGLGFGNTGVQVDPHIWVTDSEAVWLGDSVLEGKARSATHDGDGGISIYGSPQIWIFDNYMHRAGIYLAEGTGGQTHSVSIWGNDLNQANEWPVDIVQGSNNVIVASNTIRNAFFGGTVIWNSNNIEVRYNQFIGNNTSGYAACQGINITNSTNLNIHNNTANPPPVSCPF